MHTYRAGDVVIDLDPGMAFGTGTHASTRLVLEETTVAEVASGHLPWRIDAILNDPDQPVITIAASAVGNTIGTEMRSSRT